MSADGSSQGPPVAPPPVLAPPPGVAPPPAHPPPGPWSSPPSAPPWQQPAAAGGWQQPGAQGQWAPSQPQHGAAAPPSAGGGCLKAIGVIAALIVAGLGALIALGLMLPAPGEAEILGAKASMPNGHTAYLDVALILTAYPEADDADPTDVRLMIRSEALVEPISLDWAYLANKDDQPSTLVGEPPTLNAEMRLSVLLERHLKDQVSIEGSSVWLDLTLYWDDLEVDSRSIDISSLYPN